MDAPPRARRSPAPEGTPPIDYGAAVDLPYELFPESAIESTIGASFEAAARRFAGRPSVSDSRRAFDFAGLAALADDVTSALLSATDGRDGPVAIVLPHEARYAAAIFGVLDAGRACAPLDAGHPLERNRAIAAQSASAAIVSAGEVAARARALFPGDLPVIDLDALPRAPRPVPRRRPRPSDIAFILYTSGSTGAPKGVCQDHRGALHDIMQGVNTIHISWEDRLAAYYSPSVIAGLRNQMCALLAGASVRVLPPAAIGPAGVAREIREQRLTLSSSSPSLFRHIVQTLGPDEKLESLRNVLLGGDRVDWTDYDLFRRACRPEAVFRVHLGATECWTLHTQWYVDERVRASSVRLPVGYAIPDRLVTIIDENGRPVPDGETGEIAVSSRYIALGYWRDPELSARAFSVDPDDAGVRTYRTGDLALRRADGLLEFVGRKDHQIKLAGRRIEPAEVEAALRQCTGVREAAVVVRRTAERLPRAMIAYVEMYPEAAGTLARHLLAMLALRLPRYMLPAALFIVEALPTLPTFKVDRTALAKFDARREARSAGARGDALLEQVIRVVEDALRVSKAAPEDNLASLGADSLQTIAVSAALSRSLGVNIAPDSPAMNDSMRGIARRIAADRARADGARRAACARPARTGSGAGDQGAGASALTDRAIAIDRLLKEGHLEAARERVLELLGDHPELQLAKNLVSVFEHLPAADRALAPFEDDPTAALQVVRREGADTALLMFSGMQDGAGIPLPAIHRWLGRVPAHVLYLRDFQRAHYLGGLSRFGPDRHSTVSGLMQELTRLGARRVVCLGNSAGTIAALRYGLDLNAEAVLALGGPINFAADFNTHLRTSGLAASLRSRYPAEVPDMRSLYAASRTPPRTLIVFGDNAWDDRLHAECMAGLEPVTLLPLQRCVEHNVVIEVIKRGWLDALLEWLVTPGGCALPAMIPALAEHAETQAAMERRVGSGERQRR